MTTETVSAEVVDVSLLHDDETESFRPALMRMALDAEETRDELLAGFDNRGQLIKWFGRVSIRSLGELDPKLFRMTKRFFHPSLHRSDRNHYDLDVLLASDSEQRCREIDHAVATGIREHIWQEFCKDAFHRALRKRRKAAGEYLDSSGPNTDSEYDPQLQRYIAMMPAVNELEQYQQRALDSCLDGLDSRQQIVDWVLLMELATHTELDQDFGRDCYHQESMVAMLTGDRTVHRRFREMFAVSTLLPMFNEGNFDLGGKAKEMPRRETQEREAPDYL